MPSGYEFSFAPGERGIVHQDPHPDSGRIDIDELQRRSFIRIGQRLANKNFLEPGDANNIAGAGMFDLDLLDRKSVV